MPIAGTFFALAALVSWGFGDFFIQRATRRIGIVNALFFIAATGGVVLLPFVWREIPGLFSSPGDIALVVVAVGVTLISSLFDFAALKQGKISVVEPILALELPVTVGLAVAIVGERLSIVQWLLVASIFVGITLVMTEVHGQLHLHRRIMERGAIFAAVGAVAMALTSLLFGLTSRATSPLLAVWAIHSAVAVATFAWIAARGKLGTLADDLRREPGLVAVQSVLDNVAWLSYSAAMVAIPIGIATAISESYIALGVLLGILVNREPLQKHQFQGIVITIAAVALLSYLTA